MLHSAFNSLAAHCSPVACAGYAAAAALVALACLVRWAMPGEFGSTPYLVFYPAAVAAAMIGGLGPGLLATVASALCLTLFFDATPGWIDLDDPVQLLRQGVFIASGAGISLLAWRFRRALELSRRQAASLESARHSAQNAKERAEEANRAKDHFLAVLSHELRTPLTPVLAGVEILAREPALPEDSRQVVEVIRRNIELEAGLIDDLLDVTRIARGKIELDRRPVAVCELLKRTAEVCMPDIEARRLHFGVKVDGAPHMILADGRRLQQVFWNLIKNAVKFTPHGGCVGVRAWREGGQTVIEVEDSGEGIDPAELGRIFHPFEQAEHGAGRGFGGLGLGLTISKALVELHGGTIAASSPGKGAGAVFTVRLPLYDPASKMAETRAPAPADRAAGALPVNPIRARLRILLVEDHGDTARILRKLLSARGHEVTTAADVATALGEAQANRFDLLLSDLGLPDGSGIDLLRMLRGRGLEFPAIALSGYGQQEDILRCQQAGFAAHVTKPVAPDHLFEVIAGVGRRDAYGESRTQVRTPD